jgi:mRNA interferase RelE/StbE
LTFEVKVRNTVGPFLASVPEKSRRIILVSLRNLAENPFPGSGGDKEKITTRRGKEIYRLHISRSFTAFYSIDPDNRVVKVQDVLTIEQAHKKYGRF